MLLLQLWLSGSPQSIRIDLWALNGRSDSYIGSDPSCRRGVLYFKGHFQWKSRRRIGREFLAIFFYINQLLSFYRIDRQWRRFELFLVYVGYIYPVGCRDLYVVIKINILERVSSVGACYLLY